jgi:hypothetical protein
LSHLLELLDPLAPAFGARQSAIGLRERFGKGSRSQR